MANETLISLAVHTELHLLALGNKLTAQNTSFVVPLFCWLVCANNQFALRISAENGIQ
jgi:hypothetical protein